MIAEFFLPQPQATSIDPVIIFFLISFLDLILKTLYFLSFLNKMTLSMALIEDTSMLIDLFLHFLIYEPICMLLIVKKILILSPVAA